MNYLISASLIRLMQANGIENPSRLSAAMEEAGVPVPQPTISRIIKGKHKTLELATVLKFSKFFGVSVEVVLGIASPAEADQDEFVRQLLFFFNRMNDDHKDDILAMANLYYSRDNPADRKADPFASKNYSTGNNVVPNQSKVDTSKSHNLDVGIRRKIGLVDEGDSNDGKGATKAS